MSSGVCSFDYPIDVRREGCEGGDRRNLYLLCSVVVRLDEPLFSHRSQLRTQQTSPDALSRWLELLSESNKKWLFGGGKKHELTSWWLQKIENEVDLFLERRGYEFGAVPFHYLDVPPRSMNDIRGNLGIVRSILRSIQNENRTHDVFSRLIEPVSQEIYQRVSLFKEELKLVLWDEFNDLSLFPLPFATSFFSPSFTADLKRVFAKIDSSERPSSASSASLPMAHITTLKDLLSDLEYLEEMERLEHSFFLETRGTANRNGSNRKLSDIVPITGLIVSKFHRLENELKTVQQHWEGRLPS
eukprot:TRINITY_DN1074_c0_g2_i1.p1 TRINITY_DN1074_c0_g2~~TRINITY_DN1074_c0_g2_i1.p1  ORF type:complete len:301 (-),score=60.53 TRINITY_DN1074_c0_g2_i1:62-964(-)